jgi:hypothetical protein
MTDETSTTDDPINSNTAPLIVKLLYENRPELNKDLLTAKLQSMDPMIKPFDGDLCLYRNERYIVKDVAGDVAIPILVSPLEALNNEEQTLGLQQTWDWPEAKTQLSYCRHGLVIVDVGGAVLPAKDRITAFQTVLAGVLQLNPPQVVFWTTSQRLLEPKALTAELANGGRSSVLNGAVNVRSYRDQSDLSHHILDTLGLEYFGLPDFQCHFHSLEIGAVAAILYDLAAYVFEKGNVIENGHTVDGINGEQWRCSFEWSLVAPRRPLIDLHPGAPYTARKA